MVEFKKLSAEDLMVKFDFLPEFELTSEISPFKEMIGQDRAIEAIEKGLSIDSYGYNMFVCGMNGTGKKSYVLKRLREYAKKFKGPNEWCYVYNFDDSSRPLALKFKSGMANEFKEDLVEFVNSLLDEVPNYFGRDEFEKIRSSIIDKHQKDILNIVEKLYVECKNKDFAVKSTNDGFSFTPLVDGEEMTEKKYNELPEEEKERINEIVSSLKLIALDVMRKSKKIKKKLYEELKSLDEENAVSIINSKIESLIAKYGRDEKVEAYLKAVEADVTNNIEAFMDDSETAEEYDESFFKRYLVNIISSNEENGGLPVIYESYPEFQNIIGKIEYESKSGNLTTDFTAIIGGTLHKANGGFLVLDAYQLLTSPQSWEVLKKALKNEAICIENVKGLDLIPIMSFKPEEIPLKIKVILIGSPLIYYLLYHNDDDFKELFKIKADFEDEIENNNATALKMLGFISNYSSENNILPLTRSGVHEILRYSLRRGESKRYFTSSMNNITDLLIETSSIAKAKGNNFIDENHVREYITSYNKRHSNYRDRVYKMYKEGKYLIDINGYKTGEINGLTVIDYGDFSFGKQIRITVTTFAGKDGIINIEREASMSGNIHSKGIMILSGFMGETFGQDMPLSFSASICFEQLYGEVDGDSASAAELIALLSSLGNVPIKQSIAVTGSVNQRGEIQPVGGLNEKIEGFFDICSHFGLDGRQGVMIPASNVDELLLKDEIIKAVESGSFHIYSVTSIEDCFEILCREDIKKSTRRSAYEITKKKVEEKLKKYNSAFSGAVKE